MSRSVLIVAPAYAADHPRLFVRIGVTLAREGWIVRAVASDEGASPPGVVQVARVRRRRRLARLLNFPELLRLVVHERATVTLAAGLEAWLAILLVKAVRGGRVAVDLAEDYPATIQRWARSRTGQRFLSTFVQLVIRLLSRWTEIVLLSRDSLRSQLHKRAVALFVPNYFPAGFPLSDPRGRGSDSPLSLVHSGILAEERGASVLAQAVSHALDQDRNLRLRLHILGSLLDSAAHLCVAKLAALSRSKRLELRVDDWLPYGAALASMRQADVGLVLFQPVSQNLMNPMPNKAYDYMACGLAVIAPVWAGAFARQLHEAGAAMLVDTSSYEEIGEALVALASDEDLRMRLASTGFQMVATVWSMSHIGSELSAALEGAVKDFA